MHVFSTTTLWWRDWGTEKWRKLSKFPQSISASRFLNLQRKALNHTDSNGSQSGVPTGSISIIENLLENQILNHILLNQKLWGWVPAICILISPPGISDACSSLRMTAYSLRSLIIDRISFTLFISLLSHTSWIIPWSLSSKSLILPSVIPNQLLYSFSEYLISIIICFFHFCKFY